MTVKKTFPLSPAVDNQPLPAKGSTLGLLHGEGINTKKRNNGKKSKRPQ